MIREEGVTAFINKARTIRSLNLIEVSDPTQDLTSLSETVGKASWRELKSLLTFQHYNCFSDLVILKLVGLAKITGEVLSAVPQIYLPNFKYLDLDGCFSVSLVAHFTHNMVKF